MNNAAKIIEVVGTSDQGIDDAIRGAVARASETVQHLQWFQVSEIRGAIKDGAVDRFQVMLKIAFGIDEDA